MVRQFVITLVGSDAIVNKDAENLVRIYGADEIPVPHGDLIDRKQCLAQAWREFWAQEDKHQEQFDDYLLNNRLFEQWGFESCHATLVNMPALVEEHKGDPLV